MLQSTAVQSCPIFVCMKDEMLIHIVPESTARVSVRPKQPSVACVKECVKDEPACTLPRCTFARPPQVRKSRVCLGITTSSLSADGTSLSSLVANMSKTKQRAQMLIASHSSQPADPLHLWSTFNPPQALKGKVGHRGSRHHSLHPLTLSAL